MEALIKLVLFLILVAVGYWRGRRNEREHLKHLDAEEDRLAGVMTFATGYPPGVATPMDPVLVTGSAVVASDYFRLFLGNLRKIVGGNYRAYENLLDRGRRHAIVRMKQAARDKGASMIFNVHFSTCRISNSRAGEASQVEVLAYGTAFVPAAGSVADSVVHHRPGEILPGNEIFDMMKNRFSRTWVAGWFAMVFYCFFELLGDPWFAHSWRYVLDIPWAVFLALAILATGGLLVGGHRWRVPLAERIVLAILSIPALIFFLYFAALRANSWTAGPVEATTYTLAADQRLVPDHPDKPVLRFDEFADYWQAQKTGSQQQIVVARGWLGFDQVDFRPLREKYRAYYSSH